MSDESTIVSPMSRHPGLNWGPTDYESGTAPLSVSAPLEGRRKTKHDSETWSTKDSRRTDERDGLELGGAVLERGP